MERTCLRGNVCQGSEAAVDEGKGRRHAFYARTVEAQSSQRRTRDSGCGAVMKSVMTAMLSAPAARTPPARSGVMPPMAMRGSVPMRFFQVAILSRPCGSFHGLELRLVDGAERDVIGIGAECGFELAVVVGRDAERDAGAFDGRKVGGGEISWPRCSSGGA